MTNTMDDRIFPGLPRPEEMIVKTVKSVLYVDRIIGRKGQIASAKRLVVFLLQEFYNDWTLKEYGRVVNIDHATVIHYRKNYAKMYYGDNPYYTFLFLNTEAKINFWDSFEWDDIYLDIIEKMEVTEAKKIAAKRLLSRDSDRYKLNNIIVKAFTLYLSRKGATGDEIGTLLNIKTTGNMKNIKIPNESLYLSVVDSVFKDKVAFLKSQKAFKKSKRK